MYFFYYYYYLKLKATKTFLLNSWKLSTNESILYNLAKFIKQFGVFYNKWVVAKDE